MQYDEKKTLLDECYCLSAQRLSDMPKGSGISDPTGVSAERAAKMSADIELIEQCAIETDSSIYQFILDSVCYEVPFSYLKAVKNIPIEKSAFYETRRKFFYILDKKKNEK